MNETFCTGVVGSGIVCFNQTSFDNPLADPTAVVTLGISNVAASVPSTAQNQTGDAGARVASAVSVACATNECDPNTNTSTTYEHLLEASCFGQTDCPHDTCTQNVRITWNYNNANQPSYMNALLQTIMRNAQGGPVGYDFGFTGSTLEVLDVIFFTPDTT